MIHTNVPMIQTTKRQASEPSLKKVNVNKTENEKEKKIVLQLLENEGYEVEKTVSLNSVILLLNEKWDEEPDFDLL